MSQTLVLSSSLRLITSTRIPRYGLLVNLLSDGGLGSLITVLRYFIRGPQRRAVSASLLVHAFFMMLLVFVLGNAIR